MRCLPSVFLCFLALPLAAQPGSHPCASVVGASARLACYDRAFPPPPEVIEAAAEKAQADFGLDRPGNELLDPGQTAGQADPERIESRVVKVDQVGGGQRRFSLENGQDWTQTDSRSGGHVQAGDVVQVRKAIFAGYHLVMPNGVIVRVRRTR